MNPTLEVADSPGPARGASFVAELSEGKRWTNYFGLDGSLMSPPGTERHLLQDSNTSEIGGQSGNGRRTLKTSLIDPELTLRAANYCIAKGSCAFVLAALRKLS
jgi:hypothetical protein